MGPAGYAGWYCLYEPGTPAQPGRPATLPQVTIRMPKLEMGPLRFDGPNGHPAETTVGSCGDEEEPTPPKPKPSS